MVSEIAGAAENDGMNADGRAWTLAAGNDLLVEVCAESLSRREVSLRWSIPPQTLRAEDTLRGLRGILSEVFSESPAERIVLRLDEGDYDSLGVARLLGFVAEGTERARLADGSLGQVWRVALLRGGLDLQGAEVVTAGLIDGARPGALVGEFHHVYGMPNRVGVPEIPTIEQARLEMRMSLIKEEFAELCGAVYGPQAEQSLLAHFEGLPDEGHRDTVEAADALADLVYVIYGMALECGIDLDRVLAEVHRSNLSKLMPDGSVRHREDGKVLKGPNFSEPDIAAAIGRGPAH